MSTVFKKLFCILTVTFLFPAFAWGQADPFQVTAIVSPESIAVGKGSRISVGLIASPNHYIYKDQVRVDVEPLEGFQFEPFNFPAPKVKHDPFQEKEVEIYEGEVSLTSMVGVSDKTSSGKYNIKLTVHYQGCSATTCFLPEAKDFVLPIAVEPSKGGLVTEELTKPTVPPISPTKEAAISEKGTFQKTIEKKGIFAALLLAFVAGIGLSFTPCVYPMIPITVAVIGGQSAGTPLKGFLLSLVYV
ncbi:MAG: hypothetical protein HY354_04285, partial [Planctomycetes bacterium]|nr:hypothetical protein [Planctomycetota bacterium]